MLVSMPNFEYIDTIDALNVFCDAIKSSSWLALDTEFMREKTYYPQLCLLQVSNGEHIACIDPIALSIDALKPLMDIIYDPSITKIFHAASQDLEIFAMLRETLPMPLFDTQTAAALLGQGNQIGYAALIQNMCDVELDKSHSRTDWLRRPLSEAQLTYAADDVRYLGQAYLLLLDALEEQGRSDWLNDDFVQLANADKYRADPKTCWQQLRGIDKIASQHLAVAQTLAEWRELQAQKSDRPKRWILADDIVLALACEAPTDHDGLLAAGLPAKANDRFGSELLVRIRQAKSLAKEQWPTRASFEKPTAEQRTLIKSLMTRLQEIAEQHQIDPGLLATRKIVQKLVQGERDLPLLTGWRNNIAGETLLGIINA